MLFKHCPLGLRISPPACVYCLPPPISVGWPAATHSDFLFSVLPEQWEVRRCAISVVRRGCRNSAAPVARCGPAPRPTSGLG